MSTSERAHGPSMADKIAEATELGFRLAFGSTSLNPATDRSEREARIADALRKIEAARLCLRNGKINMARERAEEATRLLRGVQRIGFDPSDDENCGQT